MTYASIYGHWGLAIYFAKNASYSNFYGHNLASGEKQMFLAEVLLGDYPLPYSPRNEYLKQPPKKPSNNKERYDSIKGNHKNSDVYMVYKNH